MSKNSFINLEEVVSLWADREFDNTATNSQKKLKAKQIKKKQKYLEQQIDWSKTRFTDVTSWPRFADDTNDSWNKAPEKLQQHGPSGAPTPSTAILFQTRFTNNTKDVQEYTMRTEKTTRSAMTTEVETGYTKGFDLGVKLMTPCEVFEANAGFHREFSLTNVDGESFEEELTWGVESLIKVNPEHVAEARLVVNEKKQSGSFEIETRIRGMVYVTFTNIKDNNSFVKATGHDIGEIVKEYLEKEKKKGRLLENIVQVDETSTVIVRTRGSCKFRYGVKQDVKVDQKPINSTPN